MAKCLSYNDRSTLGLKHGIEKKYGSIGSLLSITHARNSNDFITTHKHNLSDRVLDQGAVDELNAAITGYNHDDDTRGAILGAAGVGDDGSILDAVNLNNLEDWTDWHASVTG